MSSALGGDHSLSMVEIITLPLHTRARLVPTVPQVAPCCTLDLAPCCTLLYCVAVGRRTTGASNSPARANSMPLAAARMN